MGAVGDGLSFRETKANGPCDRRELQKTSIVFTL